MRESTVLKVVSLLVAMILWVLVLSGRNFQTSKALTLRIIPPPNQVLSNTIPYYVHFHFRGPKVILKGLEKRLDYVNVDLSNYQEGEHRITFHEEMLGQLPVGVAVTSIEPSSIRVKLEPLHERVLKVDPHIIGEPAEGYRLARIELQPEKVVIRGAASRLASLTTVRTEPIRIDGLKTSTKFERQVVYEFRSGILREERPPVFVSMIVEEIPQPRLFADIPVVVRDDAGKTSSGAVWPNTVEVRVEGPSSIIKNLDATQIRAFVLMTEEVKKLKNRQLPVQIELSDKIHKSVRVVEVNPLKVRLMRE